MCPKKHLVTILNQPRHKYEYKRHDKNKIQDINIIQ